MEKHCVLEKSGLCPNVNRMFLTREELSSDSLKKIHVYCIKNKISIDLTCKYACARCRSKILNDIKDTHRISIQRDRSLVKEVEVSETFIADLDEEVRNSRFSMEVVTTSMILFRFFAGRRVGRLGQPFFRTIK